jgi:hypothetical protein
VPDSDVVDQFGEVMDGDADDFLDTYNEETVVEEERESRKRGLSIISTQSRQGSPTKKVQRG